jgi:phage shock protein A
MSYLKRLTVSLRSQVEQLVNQVEDHEAVVDAAIADAKKTLASAKVRIKRVMNDGQKLQEQINQHRQAREKWRMRAKQTATQDEKTALECLQRSHQAEQQVADLERILTEHKLQESQLQEIISTAEQRIQEKIQRRNLMSTRQSALATSQSLATSHHDIDDDWDQTFDRWESRIAEMEINENLGSQIDTLEYQFSSQERLDELRADLHELINEEKNHD